MGLKEEDADGRYFSSLKDGRTLQKVGLCAPHILTGNYAQIRFFSNELYISCATKEPSCVWRNGSVYFSMHARPPAQDVNNSDSATRQRPATVEPSSVDRRYTSASLSLVACRLNMSPATDKSQIKSSIQISNLYRTKLRFCF